MSGWGDSSERPDSAATFGEATDAVVTLSADLEVEACDSSTAELFGVDRSAIVGEPIWTLFPDAVGTVARTKMEAALQNGQRRSFNWRDPDLNTRFSVRIHPDEDRLSLWFSEIPEDGVTQRNIELFDSAQGPTGVGGWKIDLCSETLSVSENVLRIRGLPPDYDLTLEEGIRFYHPDDRPVIRRAVERLKNEGKSYDLELREISNDGELYWVRTTGVAEYDEDGKITALRGVYRDITDRKENELELKRQSHRVERQNERLNRFASVLSHDLRNPLNIAQGQLQLAREHPESERFDVIEDALSRMETLIADVLDMTRYGQEVLETEPVELESIVDQCWGSVSTADAELVVESNPTILADCSRLRQLFDNLLHNAIEHGGDGTTVTVGELADGFYLEDDGPGIPEGEREAVLRPGYTTSSNGTGFGLAIVGEITEGHKWHVRVTEGLDGGARFDFTGVEIVGDTDT